MSDLLPAAVSAGVRVGGLTTLVIVIVIGSLYHRVLGLPADQRDHGRAVLASLTELVGALRQGRRRGKPTIIADAGIESGDGS